MVSVLPPLSGTAPIITLLTLVLVFILAPLLLTFSTTATSSRAASTSDTPSPGSSLISLLLSLYMSPSSASRPCILSDQVKDWMVASSLVNMILLLSV